MFFENPHFHFGNEHVSDYKKKRILIEWDVGCLWILFLNQRNKKHHCQFFNWAPHKLSWEDRKSSMPFYVEVSKSVYPSFSWQNLKTALKEDLYSDTKICLICKIYTGNHPHIATYIQCLVCEQLLIKNHRYAPNPNLPIWSDRKSEYTEKNLNLTTKIELLYRNPYQIQSQKNLNFVTGYLNFTKFQEQNLNEWQVSPNHVHDNMLLWYN